MVLKEIVLCFLEKMTMEEPCESRSFFLMGEIVFCCQKFMLPRSFFLSVITCLKIFGGGLVPR